MASLESLLNILCCPETRQGLRLATATEIEQLNRRLAGGAVKNRGGAGVTAKIDAGLVRDDGRFLYPVRQNIPIMLIDEAIPLDPHA